MTKLSPQTQAIFNEIRENYEHGSTSWSDHEWMLVMDCCVAALRAAADQLPLQQLTREPPDQFEMGLRQGQELSRIELLDIATELENYL